MRKQIAALGLAVTALLTPAIAHAQDSAGAEALFQRGRQLFDAKKYAEACPKFAESFKLDPVTGSLLALAACHEAEGKLASAWAEYIDVATRARREGKNDRADAAQQRAATLEPKLAKLTIALAQGTDAIAGLQVKRDGIVIGAGGFGTPLPIDRGEHTIEASAPGREPFSKRLSVQDGAAQVITIPPLSEAARTEASPLPPSAPPSSSSSSSSSSASPSPPSSGSGGFPFRTVGIVTGAAGVVVIGIGGYFGAQALSKNSDSNADNHCVNDRCDSAGKQLRRDAISAGNTSTALVVVGGLLAAGGITLFIVGGSSSTREAKPAVAAAPAVGPGTAGVALNGRF